MDRRILNEHQGALFWAGLAAYVGVCDAVGRETLSNAFMRARQHNIGKYAVTAATAYVVGHLYDVWPREYDLFDVISDRLGD